MFLISQIIWLYFIAIASAFFSKDFINCGCTPPQGTSPNACEEVVDSNPPCPR